MESTPLPDIDGGAVIVCGPWVVPCGNPGPYSIRRPTPRSPYRLEVLTCTRPENHPGETHSYARPGSGVLAQWTRSGKPVYPPTINPRRNDGTTDPV